VNRVQGEERCGSKRHETVAEEPFGQHEEQNDDGGVQDEIEQVKAEGDRAGKVIDHRVSEAHQRAIVVGDALRALERPDGAAKNLA
jgi:hypothetical protein